MEENVVEMVEYAHFRRDLKATFVGSVAVEKDGKWTVQVNV